MRDTGPDRPTEPMGSDALRSFRPDAVEGTLMRGNIRGRLFGDPPASPVRLGPYELRRRIGRGGMGVVFVATDTRLHREVAIKLIALDRRPDGSELIEEARAIAAVVHDNVIEVFSSGTWTPADGTPRVYIVMPLVHGLTLRHWLTAAHPGPGAIVEAYRQFARGLAAAHRAGIVHGDVKPDNAMIDATGRVRAMDFGLAQHARPPVTGADASTPSEPAFGTAGYLAPERREGAALDPRADQWALCAALHEALIGALPPVAGGIAAAARRLPRRLLAVLRRGLDPDPRRRFADMDALAEALAPRRRLGTGAVALVAIAALAVVTMPDRAHDRCTREASLAGVWDDAARSEIRRSLSATDLDPSLVGADATIAAIDHYADELGAALRRGCDAPTEQQSCLERARASLAALREGLATPSMRAIANARAAIDRLPDCAADPRPPSPRDPELARLVARVRDDLAAAITLTEIGAGGPAVFTDLRTRAMAIDYAPLVAEVELAVARHEVVLGDRELARAALERSHGTAVAERMDALAAEAALELAMLSAQQGPDVTVAERWLQTARADAGAAMTPALQQRAGEVDFEIAVARGDHGRARALAQAHVASAVRAGSVGARVLAEHELATVDWHLGNTDEALVLAERALADAGVQLGPLHPTTLALEQLCANLERELGRHAPAIARLSRLLAIYEQAGPSASVAVVSVRLALAEALRTDPSRTDLAEGECRRALADASRGGHGHFVAMAEAMLASLLFARGDRDGAIVGDRRAIDAMSEVHGDDYPELAVLLNNHAVHLAAVGDHAASLAAATRGWRIWKHASPDDSPQDAAFLRTMARAQRMLGRDDEALAALDRAVEVTRDTPEFRPGTEARRLLAELLDARGRAGDAAVVRTALRQRCDELPAARRTAAGCIDG